MARFAKEQLKLMALEALEATVTAAEHAPLPRTRTLAFTLAFLASLQDGERWPFDNFYRDCASDDPNGRPAGLNASLNAIYRTVGIKRTLEMQGKYAKVERRERDARKGERPARNWGKV